MHCCLQTRSQSARSRTYVTTHTPRRHPLTSVPSILCRHGRPRIEDAVSLSPLRAPPWASVQFEKHGRKVEQAGFRAEAHPGTDRTVRGTSFPERSEESGRVRFVLLASKA